MNTPKIRFKGFKDDWEQRKLGALMEDGIILEQSDGNHGELYPRSEEFVNEGIPYIAASSISSDGERIDFNLTKYLSMERAIQFRKGVAKNGDVLLAHNATVGPSVMLSMDYEFAILSTSLTLYRLDKEKMSPMFFLQAIRSGYFQKQLEVFMKQTTRSQVPILTQRNLQISYPINKVEQERIGEFLSNLDHLITLHQRKCDETKQLKKFMLQKMFPKNGEKNPEIRFEGFTDDWEQRKVSDITNSYSGGTPKSGTSEYYDGNIPFIRSGEIYSDKTELFISELGMNYSSAKRVHIGDILYALYGATSGEVSRAKLDGAINQAILAIIPNQDINADFLVEWFRKEKDKIINTYLQGGQGNLSAQIIKELVVMIPSKEEQYKLGNYFTYINRLITLHQRKCDETKQLKKFMLQKMFPKNGEKNPEIRFEGFTDDWEQRKVSDITNSYSGGTPKSGTSEYYDGNIPFIRSGEIYSDKTELFISELGMNYSSAKRVHIGDILYALYGATSGEVSRAKLDGAINQAILAIIPNQDINADFLVEWFRKEKDKIINTYLQGGQGNLSAQIIKELVVMIPSKEEQYKLGNYFTYINRLITLHQRKCEKLKELKKFMLQNMFV